MNPITLLKLGGGLAGVLALAAIGWLVQDRFDQKALADAAAHCNSAAGSLIAPLDECLPLVKPRLQADRQARACEAALLPQLRPETRFAAAQACGSGVKRLIAQGDAAAGERDRNAAMLADTRAATVRAVDRAETRSTRQQQRTDHATQTIRAAPRDAGGRIACDADCLRRLAE